jgi:hypothetical protein
MKRLPIIIAALAATLLFTALGQKPTPTEMPKAQPTPSPKRTVESASKNSNTNSNDNSSDNKAESKKDKGTKVSNDKEKPAKQISVTPDDMARLPAGKSFVADTRHGAIYDFDASSKAVDFNRIKLRTDTGQISMKSLLEKLWPGKSESTHLSVGTPKDLKRRSASQTPVRNGGENFTCDGLKCDCLGDDDCNNMFGSNVCGSIAVCREDGTCSCLRIGQK